MDYSNLVLHSKSGGQLTTYYREDMKTYYKRLKPTKYENDYFYMRWLDLDTSDIIKSWCHDSTKFHHCMYVVYPTNILRDIYMYFIVMWCQWHGRKNVEVFEGNWIYMLHIMVTHGKDFNWTDVFSFELYYHVGVVKASLRVNKAPKFYMFLFLLDGLCMQYTFLALYWN